MKCPSGHGKDCPYPSQCEIGCHFNEAELNSSLHLPKLGTTSESNPGYAYTFLDADAGDKKTPNVWEWLQDLLYAAVHITGSVCLGILLALALVFATGLHRVIF